MSPSHGPASAVPAALGPARPVPDRVVVINDRSRALGGATALALLSARRLAALGVPVTLVAGDGGEGFAELRAAGVECVAVGGRALMERGRPGAFVDGLYNARARRAVEAWIGRFDTPGTVYHLHGWSKILSPAVFGALRAVADRTVLHAHDYFLACPNGGFADYPRRLVCERRPMSRACLLTQCDKRGAAQKGWRVARHALRERLLDARGMDVLLIHPAMRAAFERSGFSSDRLVALRNPVRPFCEPGSLDPAARSPMVFVGRLENEKGFADAADAASRAGVPLEFIGEGPGRAWLAEHHPDMTVHGWLDREGMQPILRRARAVVVSSRVPEPFGLAAVEALASGLPVILPDAAMLAREVVASGAGLAFETGSVDALARAMDAMRDDARVAAMAAAALRHGATFATTEAAWVDGLLDRYAARLARAERREARPVAPGAESTLATA